LVDRLFVPDRSDEKPRIHALVAKVSPQPEMIFSDIDQSSISLLVPSDGYSSLWRVDTPAFFGAGQSGRVCTVLLTEKLQGDDITTALVMLKWLLNVESFSGVKGHKLFVVGLDTETGPSGHLELAQLCFGTRVLLVRRCSGCIAALKPFLECTHDFMNMLFDGLDLSPQIVFAGAEFTGDALLLLMGSSSIPSIRLHCCLDLTSTFSADRPRSLQSMFNEQFNSKWHKDKKVTCSDWSALQLSPQQIKYGVLDVWTSEKLGNLACKNRDALENCSSFGLFSCSSIPLSLGKLLFEGVYCTAQALIDADRKTFDVPINNAAVDRNYKKQTRLSMAVFNRRLRTRHIVEAFRITRNRSAAKSDFISLDLLGTGVCRSVDGQLAVVEWALPEQANSIVNTFCENRLLLRADNSNDISIDMLTVQRNVKEIFRSFPVESWLLSSQQRETIEKKLQASVLPVLVKTKLEMSGAAIALNLLNRDSCFDNLLSLNDGQLSASHTIRVRGIDFQVSAAVHQAYRLNCEIRSPLNESQRLAVLNALTHCVSAVRGPPGTGKTSTLSALCGTLVDVGKRVLVVAPANAATTRVLESLVAAGYTNAALLVSRDYNFDWHQDGYQSHLQRFIVTPSVVDRLEQRNKSLPRNAEHTAQPHATGDLNDRSELKMPPNVWSKFISGASDVS
jgi:hypothetical protein